MSLSDIFQAKQYKEENQKLKLELEKLKSEFTPEMENANKLAQFTADLNIKLQKYQDDIENAKNRIEGLNKQLDEKRSELLDIDDKLLYQNFSLYEPKYDFINSDEYKARIDEIRKTQKELIKSGRAVSGMSDWTVNGNKVQGQKMVADMQKLLLRAFNSECDELINKVTYSNIELSEKRIEKSCDDISKLGKIMHIVITDSYKRSKLDELHLAFEYKQAKQKEKEEQKELRAQMREEAKLQKEIEAERKKAEKEQQHYQNALQTVLAQIATASSQELQALETKKQELEETLAEIDKSLKDIDYREANAKAGYVYIISNIGAFGENVYKIGMTRRLDPLERIDELGDASVPFDFDVHAMIFSDNAPALEAALHREFASKRVNMINNRREFFNVSLDEIKAVVNKNFNNSVEFIDIAPAQQYRESIKMRDNTK